MRAEGLDRSAMKDPKVRAALLGYLANYTPKNPVERRVLSKWRACQQALGHIPSSGVGGDPYASYLGACGCGS